MNVTTANPWYREPWPWLLMAGPAMVLVAGAITTWMAFSTSDGLVEKDYYKQGLAVNKVLKREEAAARLGVSAEIDLGADRHRIAIRLRGADPGGLHVKLAHATRPGHDLALRLARIAPGQYAAAIPGELPAGHWNVFIESPGEDWRLAGQWSGREAAFRLGG